MLLVYINYIYTIIINVAKYTDTIDGTVYYIYTHSMMSVIMYDIYIYIIIIIVKENKEI